MYKRMIFISQIAIILACIWCTEVCAFWLNTHEKISDTAIGYANLNSVIKEQTGIDSPLDITVTGKTLRKWMIFGSRQEDEPLSELRYLNHFYNPITNSGLADFPYYGKSSYDWAKDTQNNLYTWNMARYYYHLALVSSSDTSRKEALAKSFRAIGQVMHLVEDLAVPAHTRNDAHPTGDDFEEYVDNNITPSGTYEFANSTISVSPYAPKQFWDSETYDGSNPSDSNTQGLAEYTNANFFSEDTIFSSFTHPAKENTTAATVEVVAEDGETDVVHYISLTGQDYRLAAYSYTCLSLSNLLNFSFYNWCYNFDDEVHSDYANKLVPRAVGYSAGLLNYFFRGKINMKEDPVNLGQYIIENKSAETMSGTFSLYYDDAYNNRYPVSGASWDLSINANSQSSSLSFTKPTSPAPVRYILVFNGELGNEEGAVAGFVYNPKWAFLVIKQTSIESDVVEEECIGCENEWGYFTDSAYKWSGNGNWNSYVLKFDLEWLGEVNTITNVALIRPYNYLSCDYEITGELYNPNGHSISLIRPTAENPIGYIEVYLTGNREIYWPFPRFIRVDTIDTEGNPQSFYEPIFVAHNTLYSVSNWAIDQYMSSEYITGRWLSVYSYIPYMGMCVSDKINASYSFDLSGLSSDMDYIHSDYVNYFMYSVGEGYPKSYQQEPLLPFLPYTVEQLKIKRTWKQSTLNFLESVGYDITTIPTWDVYIDYWRTDYQP